MLAAACGQKSAPPAPVAAVSRSVPTSAGPVGARADGDGDFEILVGSVRGLEAFRRDGTGKRYVNNEPAYHPRWFDSKSVVVVRPNDSQDLAKGGWLETISLRDGKRERLAELPRFECAPVNGVVPEPIPLALQDPRNFGVGATGRTICLVLMDRNPNMMDVAVTARFDLDGNKLTRWIDPKNTSCSPPYGVSRGIPSMTSLDACGPKGQTPAAPMRASFRFSFEKERVVDARGLPKLALPGYRRENESPSGRYWVLGGDVEQGDYVHRRIVLLDRETGSIFPIREKPGTWPAPLSGSGTNPPEVRLPRTASVVGETDLRWLGQAEDSEVLLVDDLVIRPGGATFSVYGEVAR